jgi:ankyrin repeat protein
MKGRLLMRNRDVRTGFWFRPLAVFVAALCFSATLEAASPPDSAPQAGQAAGAPAAAATELDRSLREAASSGDAARVESLLKSGADPNSTDKDGITPLMIAVVGDIERVRGVAVKGLADSWQKGLGKVIKSMRGDPATARALIRGGAQVNAATPRGITALALASLGGNPALVSVLIEHGADVNQRAKRGETALMVASVAGHNAVVQLLLDRGADPLAQSQDGITAVMAAMLAGRMDTVQLLTKATAPKGATF